MAAELRESFVVPHRDTRRAAQTPRKGPAPKQQQVKPERLAIVVSRERRLISSGIAGVAAAGGALLLPFWPPGIVVALALAASLLTLRAPRAGVGACTVRACLPTR